MTPVGIVLFIASYVSARVTDRYGPWRSMCVGAVVLGIGYLVFLCALTGVWPLGAPAIMLAAPFVGAGLGMAFSTMPR